MFDNPYISVPLATWATAQLLKFVLSIPGSGGKIDFKYLYASGGMPSVHSAVVTALATTALLQAGSNSPIFGITAILAAIVMYDSFGVRRASGEQATAINVLMENLAKDNRVNQPPLKLREILGHKPLEVTVGAALGVILAALFNIQKLGVQAAFLQTMPDSLELWIYLGLFGALVVGGLGLKLWQQRLRPKSEAWADLSKKILVKTSIIGWLGLAITFAQYEKVSYLAWRIWSLLLLLSLIIWDAWLLGHYWTSLPAELAVERERQRRLRWQEQPKQLKRQKKRRR